MKKIVFAVVAAVCIASLAYPAESPEKPKPKVVLKIATLAPSGSYDKLRKMIQEKTGFEVDCKFYYGGIQGDAVDVLRKIRFRQLHGATLSGYGLGQIVPESRVTSLPYVFRNYDEVNYVQSRLEEHLNAKFEQAGYKVLGWHSVGFIYTFSKVPITSLEVAREQKFWVPENDEVANALCETLGISPVSLSITDVMTSLSTRLIDAASAPALAAVGFRWYTRFKYMSEYPLGNVLSALVITKKQWDKISPKGQADILSVSREFFQKAEAVIREKDKQSIAALKKAGIQVVRLDADESRRFIEETSVKTRNALVGKLYSRELLDRVLGLLEEYRAAHPDSIVEKIE
ncbi:MAG: TRAP transporter substrate-binding protein DctP [Thermodesulfobacteriota bacterium]